VDRNRLLDEERTGWERLAAVIASVEPSRRNEPTVTPEGWSLIDTVAHTGWWLNEGARVLAAIAAGTWNPDAEEPETAEYVERVNREHVERFRDMGWDEAHGYLIEARERACRAFGELPVVTSEAWSWLEEVGPMHYAKHVHDLTAWLAGAPSDPEVGALLQEDAQTWVAFLDAVEGVPASRLDTPEATAWGWSANDVLHHVMAWLDLAAADVGANRGWAHDGDPGVDELVDAMNARYLEEGRAKDAERIRAGLTRAHARLRGALSGLAQPTAEAKGWFRANATEHYAEHLQQLSALAGEPTSPG